ncbi:DUF5658 family protein [Rossellomorea vietnamensis]|uniref:DUF5658 family protein n=1 Tax=Rossellomorea vietnamensis TaxID=218284 RepID=UPI003CF86E00
MKLTLHFLAALNILDALMTMIGLKGNHIEEANPLMGTLYTKDPLLFLFVKLSFSAGLYLIIYFNQFPKKKWFTALTFTATTLYAFTFILHSIWITQVLTH